MTPLTKALKSLYKQIRRYNNAQEQDKPTPKHERHGTTSDWAGVVVNTILAFLTLVAIWLAYSANKTSSKALDYTKKKDSLDNVFETEKNRVDKIEKDINDAYEKKQDSLSNNRADSSLSAQINAIKFAQIQFEAINQPFLQIYDVVLQPVKSGSALEITYNIENVTNIPIQVFSEQMSMAVSNTNDQEISEMRKDAITTKRTYYITKERPFITKSTMNYSINAQIASCIEIKRDCKIYIYKCIKYRNLVTGKIRSYEAFIKISRVNSNAVFPDGTYSEFIYNENFTN